MKEQSKVSGYSPCAFALFLFGINVFVEDIVSVGKGREAPCGVVKFGYAK